MRSNLFRALLVTPICATALSASARPLDRLEPGDYALSIEAKTTQHASGRALRFTVE